MNKLNENKVKKKKEEIALEYFKSGLNCAQSVLLSYSEDFNIEENLALSITCGFGAGMGRLQETCGAVSGSFMVLGMYSCQKKFDEMDEETLVYSLIQKFSRKFKSIYGSMDCGSLLKCDLKTADGQRYYKNNNLNERVCQKCVNDSIRIVQVLIEE